MCRWYIDNNGFAQSDFKTLAACNGVTGLGFNISATQWAGVVFKGPPRASVLTRFGLYLDMPVGTYDILASLYMMDTIFGDKLGDKLTGNPLYIQVQRYDWMLNSPSFDDWTVGVGGIDWRLTGNVTYALVFKLSSGGPFVTLRGCGQEAPVTPTHFVSYQGFLFTGDSLSTL